MKSLNYFIKKNKNVKRIISGLLIVLTAGSFTIKNDFAIIKNLDIFYDLFKQINIWYVEEVDPKELIENAINGMLKDLDPYTNYIPPENKEDFEFMTTGHYGGIGALIRKKGDYAIISEPYEGFPAHKANLKAGDIIYKIDGATTKGLNLKEISERLKGYPNTEVSITRIRPLRGDTSALTLTREEVAINSVPYYHLYHDSIGYIYLNKFTQNAHQEVASALKGLKQQGASRIVLDLRGNPGGLLSEAVSVSNIFLPKNQLIVYTKGKVEQYYKEYYTQEDPIDTTISLAVLVNGNSASASEIVSGSIQDLDRGVVLGEKTFGKGLVQSTRPLSYDAQVKITTARYHIPSGRCIQSTDYKNGKNLPDSLIKSFTTKNGRKVYDAGGIMPDILVAPEEVSRLALSLYSNHLFFDFANEYMYQHDSLTSPYEFTVSDSLYDEFTNFLTDHQFHYETKSHEMISDLRKAAQTDKYYQLVKEDIDALEKKLQPNKQKDLYLFKDEIKKMLQEEIVSRYYYQKGSIVSTLINDPQLEEAFHLLQNQSRYDSILQPN